MKTKINKNQFTMKRILSVACIALLCNMTTLFGATRNVLNYGASNSGNTYASDQIQNALNACQPGDILLFPDGTYLLDNGLHIYTNNLTIIISPNALIRANTNYVWRDNGSDLFFGENLTDIEITGGGIIDGGGLVYERSTRPYDKPGRGIELVGCTNVNLHHLTVRNIPNFAINIEFCTNVIADNLIIRGRPFDDFHGSADGLDIQSSSNVIVTNCDIEVGDDALCLKVKPGGDLHNVRINNCILSSSCNAFKLGTDSKSNAYDIIAENLIINKHSTPAASGQDPVSTGDCISAITIQSNDNYNIHDFTVRNVTINSCYNPIFLEIQNRGNLNPFNGQLSGILIENVLCKKSTTQPVVLNYDCDYPTKMENITLKDITVYNEGTNGGVNITCMNGNYPEVNNNGIANAYGVWARGVNGLHLINCDFIDAGNSGRARTHYDNTATNVTETHGCSRIPIDPFTRANSGPWRNVPIATMATGSAVSFGPQPANGAWSWSGPNGFNSNSREITISNIQQAQYGTYTATYTNGCGGQSTMNFVIQNPNCEATPITPYLNANNGGWQQTTTATLNLGNGIVIGPQPIGGTWSWTGPNGFNSNSREITISNIQSNQFGTYTARYTNSCGGQSTQNFTITNSSVPVLFQAENAAITNGSINSGATGQYVDLESGGKLIWTVGTTAAGNHTAAFNVGVPSASTRNMGVYVNNTKIGVISSNLVGFSEKTISIPLNQGNNTVELRDTEGTAELNVDYLRIPTLAGSRQSAIDSESITNEIEIYPNPAKDNITINMESGNYVVDIYNSAGTLQIHKEDLSGRAKIKISDLKKGLYIVQIRSTKGSISKKIVVE